MMTRKILIAALLTCAFAPALAADMGVDAEQRAERRLVTRSGDDAHLRLAEGMHVIDMLGGPGMMGVHMQHARMVKNAPYSAEMVSERVQTLGDGNQIVRKTSSMSYRDSAGRTRTEVRNEDGEVRSVVIHDPVEGVRYILRPRDKSALKMPAPGKQGKLPEGAHERVIIKQVERSAEGKEVQIRIAQVAQQARAAARAAPLIAGAIGDRQWAAKAETTDLGTREFHGVQASGTQRSYEIPAGAIGNRQAIVVSTETWTSPELQAVVYQKRSDPRSGESIFRLDSIKRDEPAAALFSVPSDYTVKDPAARARAGNNLN